MEESTHVTGGLSTQITTRPLKEKTFVSIREAAEKIYGCTTQNLYKQIRRGNLKVYERFGHRVVSVEEVKELADFIEPRGGDRKFIPKKSEKK